jgi:hypothetical protein
MAFNNKALLRDINGIPIPQYYDPTADTYKPVKDPTNVFLMGSRVEEQKTESDAVTGTLTFSENIQFIGIYNRDTANDGVFNINGIDITVPKGEPVEFHIGGTPSATITVSGSTSYIVTRFE